MTSYLDVVRAGYAFERSDEAWVDGLAHELQELYGGASLAYVVRPNRAGEERTGAFGVRGRWSSMVEAAIALNRTVPQDVMSTMYGGGPFVELLSERSAQDNTRAAQRLVVESAAMSGARRETGEVLGIYCGSLSGGCMLSVPAPWDTIPPRTRWALQRVAVHVAAAYRLRESGVCDPDALLDETGDVLERAPGFDVHSDALAIAAESIRVAHEKGEQRPEAALSVWLGLLEGRWTLLRTIDRSGRRHLIARRNELEETSGDDPGKRRVASVIALAARGHSNKLIAYELGLPISTVASDLRDGLRTLGLHNRADLLRLGHRRVS